MSANLSLIALCLLFGIAGAVAGYQIAKAAYMFDREYLIEQRDKMWIRRLIRERRKEEEQDPADWWKL